ILGSILYLRHYKHRTINIKQCSSQVIKKNRTQHITENYQTITSIFNDNGFSRETGEIYAGEGKWILNRFYTFSIQNLSDDKYRIEILSVSKSSNDNVPDSVIKKIRPEQQRVAHITEIEELSSGVWLFSGLAYPLFACKEI
ncbi:FidL-like protein, partial [Pantoea agglomerans]|uniref:FidL-like protein n=1 Tax=Enterobacter agglomerans TaxID=549 RepID=UPI0013C7250B